MAPDRVLGGARVVDEVRTALQACGADWDMLDQAPAPTRPDLYRPRRTLARVRPHSEAEIQSVLTSLSAVDGVHLVPQSTGLNWGLGSHQPVHDDAVILDLSRMDKILDVDEVGGWAVVEPGVTQGQLAHALAGSSRMLNVTASASVTSVVGNALERGVGLHRQRVHDVAGLRVCLADGVAGTVGWWPDQHGVAPNPYLTGPSMLHLFTQSPLGIVTAAVIRLLPRPERQQVVRVTFDDAHWESVVALLRDVHVATAAPMKVYTQALHGVYSESTTSHAAYICLTGDAELVRLLSTVVRSRTPDGASFAEIDGDRAETSLERMLCAAYGGDPSSNDPMVARALGVDDIGDVGSAATGWLFYLPLVRFTASDIRDAMSVVDVTLREHGTQGGAALNVLDADIIDLVVSLRFSPQDAEAAHACLRALARDLSARGYLPYRRDIDAMAQRPDGEGPVHDAVRRALRAELDPHATLLAGRYW